MTTWDLIRNSALSPEKLNYYKRFPYSYYILRPVIYILTWIAWKAGLSANAVTFLSVICGSVACMLLASGQLVSGAALVIGFNLLDGIDGNLARMGRGGGPAGKFLDGSASIPYWFTYLALGVGVARHPDSFSSAHADWASPTLLLACGALATASCFATEVIAMGFWKNVGEGWQARKTAGSTSSKTVTESLIYKIYLNVVGLAAHDFLILLAALRGAASVFLLFGAVVCASHMVLTYSFYVRRALIIGREGV